jgi:hypothetical protein
MKKLEAEESAGDGDGEENVPTSAQIEGLDGSDHEGDSDSDEED